MYDKLSPNVIEELDLYIFENKKILFLQRLGQLLDTSLPERLEILTHRYDDLRANQPDRFTQSHDEYWRNVYS